jgi:molybdenum cofactor cytidylyltransferase
MSISVILLAAGKSKRMGQPKMLLPWGKTTVLGKVIETLQSAGVEEIVIVTNSEIAPQISNYQLPITINDSGEMLASIQTGLRSQKPSTEAALICLGDQPQIEERSVRSVCEAFQKTKSNLVVPSYQMRRGHPWLAARPLWGEILTMREPETMRDFLNKHNEEIHYIECGTPTILQDVDTPEDYLKYKPSM